MANDSHYGLSAFVWSKRHRCRVAHRPWSRSRLGAGESRRRTSYSASPTAGFKQSGIGREFSLEGMLDGYTRTKHVSVHLGH